MFVGVECRVLSIRFASLRSFFQEILLISHGNQFPDCLAISEILFTFADDKIKNNDKSVRAKNEYNRNS